MQFPREHVVNIDWGYNWGIQPRYDTTQANFEFVPMIWSANTGGNNLANQINAVLNLEDEFGIEISHVLGFNEPELSTQANMSVQQALDAWDVMTNAFESTDLKMVSPAVSGNGGLQNWLYPFMDEVESRNADGNPGNDLQVDAIAYHFYTVAFNPQAEANKVLEQIDEIWSRYQRPIWLTEFAGTSFSLDNPVHSIEERTAFNKAFLEILIPEFEARPYLERYAWWQFGALGQPYSALSTVSEGVFTPTSIGEVYSGTTLQPGESNDFSNGEVQPTYVHYLKDAILSNFGDPIETALRAIDILEGDNTITGSGDWGLAGSSFDTFVRVRAGTTLRKQGANTITFKGAEVINHGEVYTEDGRLDLRDGTRVTGDGGIHVESGSILRLGGAGDFQGARVDQGVELRGGGILQGLPLAGGANIVSGTIEISLTAAQLAGEGDLTLTGRVTGNGGGFTKLGSGALFLIGDMNNYSGITTITNGELIAENTSGSATGASSVLVDSGGTLAGSGSISGPVIVFGDGTVSPGVAQSNLGATSVPAINEGAEINAIDFNFANVQNSSAPLNQTSTLSSALQLVSGFDFGNGVVPSNVTRPNAISGQGFDSSNDYSDALADGSYFTFTIAPEPGLAMLFEDVSFQFQREGPGAPLRYRVMSSIDGFQSFEDRVGGTTNLDENNTQVRTHNASYSGGEMITEPLEVRLYAWQASSSTGTTHLYNVSLDASFYSDPDHVKLQPTGRLNLNGNYTQLDFGILEVELAGTSNLDPNNREYDQLLVAGDVSLNGTLELSFLDGFTPEPGDTFDIVTANSITGSFDTINAPTDVDLRVNYLDTVVQVEFLEDTFLMGDINCDGFVNLLDVGPFVDLISSGGFQAKADINGDGVVDLLDVTPFVNLLQGG